MKPITIPPLISEVFGKRGRLLEEFLDSDSDLTRAELSERTGLSPKFVYQLVDEFIESGILLKTRTVGKADFYKLNGSSLVVRTLVEYELSRLEEIDKINGFNEQLTCNELAA